MANRSIVTLLHLSHQYIGFDQYIDCVQIYQLSYYLVVLWYDYENLVL